MLAWVIAATGAWAVVTSACAAVPDISFAPSDAAVFDAPSDGSDAAVDAASDAPVVACPNGPPAGGICCGNVPCYQCQNQNDCARCTTASCVAPEVCCRRNGNKVECTAADSCN